MAPTESNFANFLTSTLSISRIFLKSMASLQEHFSAVHPKPHEPRRFRPVRFLLNVIFGWTWDLTGNQTKESRFHAPACRSKTLTQNPDMH